MPASFVIAADDPCLDGHFPDRPVVPGVVVLDEALHLLRQRLALGEIVAIQQAKFLRPVLPGEQVDVACGTLRDGLLTFSCTVGDRAVAGGVARFA